MGRHLFPVGALAGLTGAALMPPVIVARLEDGVLTPLGIGIVSFGCAMILGGAAAVSIAFWRPVGSGLPSGARMAVTATILILAFLALELSDRLILRDGKLFYWTTFLFPPAVLLFCGLVDGRTWAWWVARGSAALGVTWFLVFLAMIPFVHLQAEGVPIPWYGRIYMGCVTVALAAILAAAFCALGRPDTRNYFGLIRTRRPPNQAVNPRGGSARS